MNTPMNQSILASFDDQHFLFGDFTGRLKELVAQLLDQNNIDFHEITSRVKERQSLERKLRGADGTYSSLNDVTDICGVRIITHFADTVYEVAKVIESEFAIDYPNSVDKGAQLDPDRFGYISFHFVVKLPEPRLQLTEYKRYSKCHAEIQIRSLLQHTWAQIEHDLGYNSAQAVPKDIRRRFSRLAGLLEIADSEFEEIRDELKRYEQELPGRISASSELVLIDQASVSVFISCSLIVTPTRLLFQSTATLLCGFSFMRVSP